MMTTTSMKTTFVFQHLITFFFYNFFAISFNQNNTTKKLQNSFPPMFFFPPTISATTHPKGKKEKTKTYRIVLDNRRLFSFFYSGIICHFIKTKRNFERIQSLIVSNFSDKILLRLCQEICQAFSSFQNFFFSIR